jgi:hypothetical protein
MKKLVVIFCTLSVLATKAQDPHFSQFFASPLTLNPAFTGKFDGLWRLAANHRDQWPSIPKAYVTSTASLDFPILKRKFPIVMYLVWVYLDLVMPVPIAF